MARVRNISIGTRGGYLGADYVEAEPGRIIELDDFSPEWFKEVEDGEQEAPAPVDPLEAMTKRAIEAEGDLAEALAKIERLEDALASFDNDEPGPLDQSIEKLTAYLETVTDADEVERLIDAETLGKSRAGAITALEARRDALLAA